MLNYFDSNSKNCIIVTYIEIVQILIIYHILLLRKQGIFLKKKTTRHASQRSAFNPEHPAFLKIHQNMKYITKCQKRFNKHFLCFKGGHFHTKFDRKFARLMDQIRRQSAAVQKTKIDHIKCQSATSAATAISTAKKSITAT